MIKILLETFDLWKADPLDLFVIAKMAAIIEAIRAEHGLGASASNETAANVETVRYRSERDVFFNALLEITELRGVDETSCAIARKALENTGQVFPASPASRCTG